MFGYNHWAGVVSNTTILACLLKTMFLVNSWYSLFNDTYINRYPFLLTYGAILPNSFRTVILSPGYTLPPHWSQFKYSFVYILFLAFFKGQKM